MIRKTGFICGQQPIQATVLQDAVLLKIGRRRSVKFSRDEWEAVSRMVGTLCTQADRDAQWVARD